MFNFDPEELEGIAPHSVQEQYLTKFGFSSPPLPEGYSHVATSQASAQNQNKSSQSQSNGFGAVDGGGERINVLIAKRSNKKRLNLTTQVGSVPTAALNGNTSISTAPPASKRMQLDTAMRQSASAAPTFSSPFEQPFDVPDTWSRRNDVGLDLDVPIDSIETKGKRKASSVADLMEDVRPMKARTLGGDRPRDIAPIKEIGLIDTPATGLWEARGGISLPVPALLTSLTADIEGSDDMFEGRNSEDGGEPLHFCLAICIGVNIPWMIGPTEVFFASGKQTQWLDYLPSPVLAVKATLFFCAAAMQDGSVNVYSPTGRRYVTRSNWRKYQDLITFLGLCRV